jgi:hypothetical protein
VRLGRETLIHCFLCSGRSGAVSIKSILGHVVHYGVSGAQDINALFSCLGGPGAVSMKSVS